MKNLYIYIVFLILSILIMFPVIINMSGVMYGMPGDPYYRIWETWHFKYAFLNNTSLYFTDFIGAPFGTDLTIIPHHLFWDKLLLFTSLIANEVFSYNLFMFLSFLLSGITMYHLAFYLIKSRHAAFFSGILYMFCPYHLARAMGHITLANIQWLPLFILLTIKFSEKHSLKSSLLLGFSLGLVFISNYYYGIFSYVVFFIFLSLLLFINKVRITKKFILFLLIALLLSAAIIAPFILPVYMQKQGIAELENGAIAYARPLKEIFAGTARPLSYLLPSYMHPIFGGITKLFVGSPLYGESKGENCLYLGIFPLILAWIAVKTKTKISKIFLYLFIVTILFSLPPYLKLFNLIVPMPSFLILKLVPRIRVYARFGVFAMLCISVLAGFGLKQLMARLSDDTKKKSIYALSIIIVFIEFLVNPLKLTTDLSQPPAAYVWLSQQEGDFIICEYPLSTTFDMRADRMVWQRVHKKKKADDILPGSRSAKIKKYILRLQDRNTPRFLSWLGVKYVIVHLDEMKKSETLDVVGVLPDFSRQPGLTLMKKLNGTEIYKVTARPLKPDIL